MKKSIIKRSISLFTAALLALSLSVPVFAASAVSEEDADIVRAKNNIGDTASPMYSTTEGFNAGYINGPGGGSIKVTIGRSISTAYLQAAVSSNNNSGTILVCVRYPSGGMINLGSMSASGGHTTLKQVYGLSSGTYEFLFYPSGSGTFNVQGYIYK